MIPRIDTVEDEKDFWESRAARAPLTPLDKPCHDCAVTSGFYGEIVAKLEEQPREIRDAVCRSWFCHNKGNRSCRGAIDHFKVEP